MRFFSPSRLAFYERDSVPDETLPDDADEISEETYQALQAGLAAGKHLVVGEDKAISLVDPVVPVKFFSPSTLGFYTSEIHTPDMRPSDAVQITDEHYAELLASLGSGKTLGADDAGAPVLLDPPAPTVEELMAGLRYRRNQLLTQSDWTQGSDSPLSTGTKAGWAIYRQALRDLPAKVKDPAKIDWPAAPGS